MKRIVAASVVLALLTTHAQADPIKPVDITATSQFGVGLNIVNLVNGDSGPDMMTPLTDLGLIDNGGSVLTRMHRLTTNEGPSIFAPGAPNVPITFNGWQTGCADGGIAGGSPSERVPPSDCTDVPVDFVTPPLAGPEDPLGERFNGFDVEAPADTIIEFELDSAYDLTDIYIWNMNQPDIAPTQGVDEFEIWVNTERTGGTFVQTGTTYNIVGESGVELEGPTSAQQVTLVENAPGDLDGIRRVRLLINSNLVGEILPDQDATSYVGMAEVRFDGTLATADPKADANKDGVASGLDFLNWQFFLGAGEEELVPDDEDTNSRLTSLLRFGDFDNNNVTNAADLAAWEAEFLGALSASSGVPEPSTLLLAGSALIASMVLRRRRLSGQV